MLIATISLFQLAKDHTVKEKNTTFFHCQDAKQKKTYPVKATQEVTFDSQKHPISRKLTSHLVAKGFYRVNVHFVCHSASLNYDAPLIEG